MKRFIYWMERCLKIKNIQCYGFCATCKYYERCLLDGEDGRKLRKKTMENLKRRGSSMKCAVTDLKM